MRNRRFITNKLSFLALAALVSLTGLAGCGSPAASGSAASPTAAPSTAASATSTDAPAASTTEPAGKLDKVNYASFTGMTAIGFWLGMEKGMFKEDGLDITNIDAQDKVAALISGDVDFADMSTSPAIAAIAKGAPFKIVGSMFRTRGAFHLIGSPDIQSIEDLKGKKIGVLQVGSALDINLRIILKEHGLDADKDVTLISNGAGPQALASLEAKQVDATMIHEPFVQVAKKNGTGHLLALGWDYMPEFNTGVLVASDKFIKEHPDTLKKLIASYFRVNVYAKEHRDELLEFGANYIKVDKESLAAALDSEAVIWENKPEVDLNTLVRTQEIQKEFGLQKEIYDVEKMVDLRFLPGK